MRCVDLVRSSNPVDACVVDPEAEIPGCLCSVGGALVGVPVADVADEGLVGGADLLACSREGVHVAIERDDMVPIVHQPLGDCTTDPHGSACDDR